MDSLPINSQTTSWPQALLLWVALLLHLPPAPAAETPGPGTDTTADSSFRQGRQYYEKAEYEAAIAAFTTATTLSPETAAYHHWLGKSYGRLAEQSSLLQAYRLARKTRAELERAVALDDRDIEAVSDLMEYYRQAPAFLGGSRDQADRLRHRLEELQPGDARTNVNQSPPVMSNQ